MRFNELELKRQIKKGLDNLTPEEEINLNILNFIHTIHMNKQDFFSSTFDSHFFGDVEMTFKKRPGCLIGHVRAIIKKENRIIDYLFTDQGYELLGDLLRE